MADLLPPSGPEDIHALTRLTPEQRAKAEQIAAQLDTTDSNALLEFAVAAQQELSQLADPILNKVTTKDTGPVGETLQELMVTIRDVNAGQTKGGWFSKVPGVTKAQAEIQKVVDRYEKVGKRIDKITEELRSQRQILLNDINWLDQLYARNAQSYQDLMVYIAAGELKLEELRQEQARLIAEAQKSGDMAQAQAASDIGDTIVSLERRVYDLKLTAMISLQAAPQIRLVQAGDKALVEKIQSSILTTIPLWKNAISIAVALYNQSKALEIQRAVSDTTNELLLRNSQLLQQGMTGVARESERGVVEMETLVKVNDQLVATIEETIRIQQEGHKQRMAAEAELQQMQGKLAKVLTAPRPNPQIPGKSSL